MTVRQLKKRLDELSKVKIDSGKQLDDMEVILDVLGTKNSITSGKAFEVYIYDNELIIDADNEN